MTQNVRVTLKSTVVYVTGTVNSVPVTWTRVGANDWEAVSEKSADNKYAVNITAIDSAGNSATYELQLLYGLQLITDRTQQDVDNETEKGYYWITDMNRVGSAVKYLTSLVESMGYTVDALGKSDWSDNYIPSPSELDRYLADVQNLRNLIEVDSFFPKLPSTIDNLGHIEANNIERCLELLEFLLFEAQKAWFYSAEISCGEV